MPKNSELDEMCILCNNLIINKMCFSKKQFSTVSVVHAMCLSGIIKTLFNKIQLNIPLFKHFLIH